MFPEVKLFIDGIHFGIAIETNAGWYKIDYAAGTENPTLK